MFWNVKIAPFIHLRELRCKGKGHNCWLTIIVPELVQIATAVRTEFREMVVYTSWSRCTAHNADVGGAHNSYHLNGRGLDCRPSRIRMDQLDRLEEIARKHYPFVKRYTAHIHCDIRGERPAV